MTWNPRSKAAIAGVGTSQFARDTGLTTTEMIAKALRAALDDSGLTIGDIDGLYINAGGDFDKMAEQLGMKVGYAMQFWTHGRMCAPTLQQAALSVAAGLATHVACVYSIDISERGGGFGGGRSHGHEEYREGGGTHGHHGASIRRPSVCPLCAECKGSFKNVRVFPKPGASGTLTRMWRCRACRGLFALDEPAAAATTRQRRDPHVVSVRIGFSEDGRSVSVALSICG